jgi:hypothetical protein
VQHIVEKQAAAGVDIGNDELLSLLFTVATMRNPERYAPTE